MSLFVKETGSFRSTPTIEKILLERNRIIHKAANKLEAIKAILKREFNKRKNLKYTLIYVPKDLEEKDFRVETKEDNRLINEYTKVVSQTDDSVSYENQNIILIGDFLAMNKELYIKDNFSSIKRKKAFSIKAVEQPYSRPLSTVNT